MSAVLKPEEERKAMAGDYYVLRGKLPSALVECGFLSNAREEKLLLTKDYHLKIAQAVSLGLSQWMEAQKHL
jgi:N-acetylmuramoyl-L-alanine amidase